MATAFNVHHTLWVGLENFRTKLDDPGANGTIRPGTHQIEDAYVVLASAGTNAFESAAISPLGARLTVYAQASVTANGLALADGEFATWRVTLDSNGAKQWSLVEVPSTIAATTFVTDAEIEFGDDQDAVLGFESGDADNHTLVLGLDDVNETLHITDKAAIATDWNIAAFSDPTVLVHSNTTPETDYLLIGGHDGTSASIDVVGGTTFNLAIDGTPVAVLDAGGFTFADNVGDSYGTGDDASILWDATNLVIDVDSGAVNISVATNSIVLINTSGVTLQSAGDGFHGQGSNIARLSPIAAIQNITAGTGGAINVTAYYTTINTDATDDAYTLANGTQVGQRKKIRLITDGGGNGVITPTSLSGGTTITFADAADEVELAWNGTAWVMEYAGNAADGVTAPVLA